MFMEHFTGTVSFYADGRLLVLITPTDGDLNTLPHDSPDADEWLEVLARIFTGRKIERCQHSDDSLYFAIEL